MCADLDRSRSPTNRHRLIVRHPTRAGVIGVDESAAGALPRIDTDDRHTADVGDLGAAVESRYGVQVTVLRSLLHGDVRDGVVERAHELEVHGGLPQCSLGWRSATTLTLVDEDRAALEAWRAPSSNTGRCDWAMPGWFDRARVRVDRVRIGSATRSDARAAVVFSRYGGAISGARRIGRATASVDAGLGAAHGAARAGAPLTPVGEFRLRRVTPCAGASRRSRLPSRASMMMRSRHCQISI